MPSDYPLKDKMELTVTPTSTLVLRSMAVNLEVTPQVLMFAPSAGMQRVFLCEAVSDCPSPSLSNIAAFVQYSRCSKGLRGEVISCILEAKNCTTCLIAIGFIILELCLQ